VRGLVKHLGVGFLMGSADVVPGVSGGTVALVCGIYARLIDAIRDGARAAGWILQGRLRDGLQGIREVDWALLVPLLAGIGAAVLTLASVIEHLLDEEPVKLGALFFGLVAGTVLVAWGLLRRPGRAEVAIILVTAVVLFLLLGLRTDTTAEAAETATAPLWAFPASGAVAICAMILPGVSGSFLLVMLGMYSDVLGAVNDRDLLAIALFLAGCVVGLAVFARLLAWLLDHHHDRVVAAMIGLMLGSVRVLWPWPGGTSTTELAAPAGDVLVPVALAAAGFLAVVVLGRLGAIQEEPVPHPG
jgi:putative membrane protein